MNWKAGYVTVDEGDTIVPGEWRTDYRWNGWLCPRMKFESIERVLRALAVETEHFTVMLDGLDFVLLEHVYEDEPDYEAEIFSPDEDGWYYPGYMGWCWEEAPRLPRSEFVLHFNECPECGGHRYAAGRDVNRYGQGMTLYSCFKEGHEPLADLDLQLEWNEDWTLADDGWRLALAVREYDNLPSQDVLDVLGVDTRFTVSHIVTWQELVDVYGEEAVWKAAWRFL
jgi:hypothetical protein